jgi:uncharacterized membrane protein YeaQ/YmgE (transglycosylase-associated protein family)
MFDRTSIMGFTAAILVGLLAGALASLFLPRQDGLGIATALAIGVSGALMALGLGRRFAWYGIHEGGEILGVAVGATFAVTIYRLVRGGR